MAHDRDPPSTAPNVSPRARVRVGATRNGPRENPIRRWRAPLRRPTTPGDEGRDDATGVRVQVGSADTVDTHPLTRLTTAERSAPNATTNLQLGRVLPRDLTADAVEEVASELVREGKSAATRARMLSAWRGFSRWLVLQGHLVADPTLAFETPMADSRLPVAFSDEELRAILKAAAAGPDVQTRAQWPLREVALIGVLAGAGLRAAELAGLEVGDIGHQVDERQFSVPSER